MADQEFLASFGVEIDESGHPDLLSSAPAAAAPVIYQNLSSSVQASVSNPGHRSRNGSGGGGEEHL